MQVRAMLYTMSCMNLKLERADVVSCAQSPKLKMLPDCPCRVLSFPIFGHARIIPRGH